MPELFGPFDTEEERDAEARRLRQKEGPEHGIFRLSAEGKVEVDAYSGAELDDVLDDCACC